MPADPGHGAGSSISSLAILQDITLPRVLSEGRALERNITLPRPDRSTVSVRAGRGRIFYVSPIVIYSLCSIPSDEFNWGKEASSANFSVLPLRAWAHATQFRLFSCNDPNDFSNPMVLKSQFANVEPRFHDFPLGLSWYLIISAEEDFCYLTTHSRVTGFDDLSRLLKPLPSDLLR